MLPNLNITFDIFGFVIYYRITPLENDKKEILVQFKKYTKTSHSLKKAKGDMR